MEQGLRGGPRGGAGSHDVVHQQDVLRVNSRGIGDGKCAAYIQATLARGEAGLRIGGPQTHESAWSEGQPPFRMRPAKDLESMDGERTRLIETALRIFGAVQRHRNDEHFGRSIGGELRDGIGEHTTKPARRRVQAVVLEGMDCFSHAALIETIGNGADKRRRRQATRAAKR